MKVRSLFSVEGNESNLFVRIKESHNDESFQKLKEHLFQQYNLNSREPNIQIQQVSITSNRCVVLRYAINRERLLK